MIGCLIFGSLAAMGVARALHHRRFCGGGGWGGGGWHGYGHSHFGGGYGGGGPFARGEWGSSDYEEGADFRMPFGGGFPGFGAMRGGGKRFFIRRLLDQIRATPAQERVVASAVEEFRDEMKKATGGEARRSRQEIVEALRRPTFDGVMLGEQFARHDTVLEGARKAFVGLMAKVHDALDPEQRERLADLVDRGPRFGGWSRGF
jgi:hypothetical protein